MTRKRTRFLVYNRTDAVLADPRLRTRQEAEEFVRLFPKRFERQGYYLTATGLRIPAEDVELESVGERRPGTAVAGKRANRQVRGRRPEVST